MLFKTKQRRSKTEGLLQETIQYPVQYTTHYTELHILHTTPTLARLFCSNKVLIALKSHLAWKCNPFTLHHFLVIKRSQIRFWLLDHIYYVNLITCIMCTRTIRGGMLLCNLGGTLFECGCDKVTGALGGSCVQCTAGVTNYSVTYFMYNPTTFSENNLILRLRSIEAPLMPLFGLIWL